MSKKACGMKDNFPRQIPWRFGLTTITKVHYQSNKWGDEYEFRPRAKSPINHFLKDGSGPRVWIWVKRFVEWNITPQDGSCESLDQPPLPKSTAKVISKTFPISGTQGTHPPPPPPKKSPISWWKYSRTEGWWDKYLPNPARNKTVREREGKMVYKKRGGATRKGIQQNLRENFLRRIKERVIPAE